MIKSGNVSINKTGHEENKEVYKLYINELKSNLRKEKYKKVLEDIEVGQKNFSKVLDKCQIMDLKVTTYFKIFYNFFYENDLSILKDPSNTETFLNKIDKLIEELDLIVFQEQDELNKKEFLFKLESVITAYLTQLYTYSLVAKKERKCGDCCAYLGIAEKLIKGFVDKTKNNKFLFISTQVYLFISSLQISDENYHTAQIYQKQVLTIAFRIISYLNINNEYIDKSKLRKSHWNYIEKALLSICIAFYHRGFCLETLGNLSTAFESYSQAKWFSDKFLMDNYIDLGHFITDVYLRVSRDLKAWMKSQRKMKNDTEFTKNNKSESEMKKLNEMDYLKIQFKETINKIEKLKFPIFDEDRRINPRVQEILYTLKMTNSLMSSDFKNLVADMEKLQIHKIDKETNSKINKKLIEIRARESYERFCKAFNDFNRGRHRSHTVSPNALDSNKGSESKLSLKFKLDQTNFKSDLSSNKSTSRLNKRKDLHSFLMKGIISRIHSSKTPKLHITTDQLKNSTSCLDDFQQNSQSYKQAIIHTDDTSTYNNKEFELLLPDDALNYICTEPSTTRGKRPETERIHTDKQETARSTTFLNDKKKEKIKKFPYNKFIFNQNYQKKLNVLNTNFNKELDFQKRLLRLKKTEKLVVEEVDVKKKADEYHFKFWRKIKEDRKIFIKKKELKHKKEVVCMEGKSSKVLKTTKLEERTLRSLDTKNITDIKKLLNEKRLDELPTRDKKPCVPEVVDNELFIKQALTKMMKIDEEMRIMKKIENQKMKVIHPVLYKERPLTSRKPIVEKEKKEYNKNFTKINGNSSLQSGVFSAAKSPNILN